MTPLLCPQALKQMRGSWTVSMSLNGVSILVHFTSDSFVRVVTALASANSAVVQIYHCFEVIIRKYRALTELPCRAYARDVRRHLASFYRCAPFVKTNSAEDINHTYCAPSRGYFPDDLMDPWDRIRRSVVPSWHQVSWWGSVSVLCAQSSVCLSGQMFG